MSSYLGTADRPDRAKAIAAVVAVHVALAAVILTGLNGRVVMHAVESLKTFDIRQPPPPPPPPPPPRPSPKPKARLEEGAAGKKAEPSPIVAPKPKIPVTSPLPAAPIAGTGSAAMAGAATAGTGTGAGGSGNGRGGGGNDFSGYTPARLIRNIPRGDYRSIAAGALPMGSADAAIIVSPRGVVSSCRLIRSSGNATVDARLCPLIVQRLRFRPALDASGRPIDFRTNFHATWSVGF